MASRKVTLASIAAQIQKLDQRTERSFGAVADLEEEVFSATRR